MSTQKNEHEPEPELKPCPFCGSAATRGGNRCVCTNGNCQASIIPMLISHWNRRITPPTDTTGSGREGETPEVEAAKVGASWIMASHSTGDFVHAELAEKLERQRDAALAQVEALRRDGERIETFEKHPDRVKYIHPHWYSGHYDSASLNPDGWSSDGQWPTLRAAIDSAQRQEGR